MASPLTLPSFQCCMFNKVAWSRKKFSEKHKLAALMNRLESCRMTCRRACVETWIIALYQASESRSPLTLLSGNINQPSFEKIDQFLRWPDPRVCVGLTISISHEHLKSVSV
jgi:hypothetical protein